MSTLSKTLALLDFFGPDSLQVNAEAIVERTGLSKATVYRYVKDLCDAGLLTRVGGGNYSLGPRIVELDWMMRQYDPILIVGREHIHKLAEETRLAVLCSAFYDDRIINTYIFEPVDSFAFHFGRGQPMPFFWGAQSKVLVSYQNGRRLQKLFEQKIACDPEHPCHGWTWLEFARATKKIRKAGYCVTTGELTSGLTGIAAPVLQQDGREANASICVLGASERFALLSRESVIERLMETARCIAAELAMNMKPTEVLPVL